MREDAAGEEREGLREIRRHFRSADVTAVDMPIFTFFLESGIDWRASIADDDSFFSKGR